MDSSEKFVKVESSPTIALILLALKSLLLPHRTYKQNKIKESKLQTVIATIPNITVCRNWVG